jgi:N-acetylmuramoyl-L-alanine amidase
MVNLLEKRMALIKDVTDCSTFAVRGLDIQLIYQMNKISPGLLVRIDDLNVALGGSVHPWMQAPAKINLAKAIAARGKTMTINSAYRTLAGQMLLRTHYRNSRCGISAAAAPGKSNHNNASAIDIEDADGWRSSLESANWRWIGSFDPVHYDCVDPALKTINQIAVQAFQQIWNSRRPNDPVADDGDFGPVTASRLRYSPAEGFSGLDIPRMLKFTEPLQLGNDVEALQNALRKVGIQVEVNKVFGQETDRAVRQFQTDRKLFVDGIVGSKTRQLLGLPDPMGS